ncbi:MAG: hypothetical protein IT462_08370 [Planctomycetes bacterium]|nr:hypothetical protein [Planctomycetota bacterium]
MAVATYKPSGKMGWLGWVLGLEVGALVAIGLAYYYIAIRGNGRGPIVSIAMALFIGAAIGCVVGVLTRLGKSRSQLITGIIAVVCGVVALGAGFYFDYVSFGDWLAREAAREGGSVDEFRKVWTFPAYLKVRVEGGWQYGPSLADLEFSGAVVYLFWAIEAALFLLPAFFISRLFVRRSFCEACNCWTVEKPLGRVPGVQIASLIAGRESGSLTNLLDPEASRGGHQSIEYFLHYCPACNDTKFLSIGMPKGGLIKHEWVVRYATVTDADLELLEQSMAERKASVRNVLAMAGRNKPRLPGNNPI